MSALDHMFGIATVVPEMIDAATATAVREQLAYAHYGLVDRGSYDHAPVDAPGLLLLLREIAMHATGRTLAIAESRALRLGPGDYVLAHHDRLHADNPVEIVADLSPAAVPDAEVHYRRRGQVFFRFPCVPGAIAVVERGPTVSCNHTYVSKLHHGVDVVRVIALLR